MKSIKKAMVIGAGVMGAQIAAHLANCGLEVMLVDIVPPEKDGVKPPRNLFADTGKKNLSKLRPAPLMDPNSLSLITTGNLEDDLSKVAEVDWVIEAIVERLDVKKNLFKNIAEFRKGQTIVSSNTSGISIQALSEDLDDDFQAHFLGTHFFNPPRYLHLMELIPGPKTDGAILDYLTVFMERQLGKGVVLCKDTPNFIGNRVGVMALMVSFEVMKKYSLNVTEVDALTGPLLGRPKSATFRTADVVGLDTMKHVLGTLEEGLSNDREASCFLCPEILQNLVSQGALGDKTGQGFYKKTMVDGKRVILALDPNTEEYAEQIKPEFYEIKESMKILDIEDRVRALVNGDGSACDFLWEILSRTLNYAALTCCDISHDIQSVDEALKFGFGWEKGPFELWDAIGLKESVERMEKDGLEVALWVKDHVAKKQNSFYRYSGDGRKGMADPFKGGWMGYRERGLDLNTCKIQRPIVFENNSATLVDIGDGVVCLEFHTRMNAAGRESIESIIQANQIAEDRYKALVLGNHGAHFCAGANLKELLVEAKAGNYDEIRKMIANFQKASMAIKYSGVPVVVAAHGMALGGGCEFVMHANAPMLGAESYIGLVEMGVGLLPAGGGTKEFAIQAHEAYQKTGGFNASLKKALETIGMAKVSGSGKEARGLYLDGHGQVVMNHDHLLQEAKGTALHLVDLGFAPGAPRKDILVAGSEGFANLDLALYLYQESKMISEYDGVIGRAIARILTGGGVSNPTVVSEEYLLELELDEFLQLIHNDKTQARIEHMLKTGKALRN